MESLSSGAAPSSLIIATTPSTTPQLASYKQSIRPKGHYRSSSLENNPFAGGKSTLSLVQTNFTGTLKSRREQKRISDFLSKQSLSAASSQNGARDHHHQSATTTSAATESSIRKAHFENIREIFEKNNSKNSSKVASAAANTSTKITASCFATPVNGYDGPTPTAMTASLSVDDKPPKIQSCSGILGKGKQVIRPIAFKPVPYKCNTPNYAATGTGSTSSSTTPNNGGRLTDLGDRYGSTPSLGPPMSIQYKFGSTTDLHHHHHHHTPLHSLGAVGSGAGTPGGSATPNGSFPHHGYGSLFRKTASSIPFKTYDSLESILKLPDSMIASYPNPSTSSQSASLYAPHDHLLDMAPSPSDSGISELEAALRDRDSELAYLRQTMEHNEQVIFKVHQDKEKHWEQELNRLKAIHESRLRAGAQKVHKLEQLLMMQTFQLRQDKKRLQEDILHSKEQLEAQNSELRHLKLAEKDCAEEIQMLRRVVSDLKERLEESEWSLCQRNGEVALMKTQLKEAQTDVISKDQEILQLKTDLKLQNIDEISMKKSEIKKELDFDLEISQLNRIIIFKDQIIVVMNNEIQKLRKELSDISIMRGYEGVPAGRYSRYKKKLDYVTQKFEESTMIDGNNNSKTAKSVSEGVEGDALKSKKGGEGELSSSEIIRNYFNNKLELNKKLFLNTQICNYSDEDKSSFIETYNAKKLPDITLDLSTIGKTTTTTTPTSGEEVKDSSLNDSYKESSSDDDYKSMTPTREQEEGDEDGAPVKNCDKDPPQDKDRTVGRLRQELQEARTGFEQERQKWAEEKEKVLVYQRQLQQNYVEMCKRTAALEERLKKFEKV
ncbi:leucine zipper putative tumor suppressor 2 homolog isoform X1 [Culex pipiens pallens]|uniref:leucine zipper putative tumor suppressor 2 homolog isoform X1 n=1 Tax=Culex pipiens pallens TaxID=42434 RepID=UPI0019535F38|nr:leucine zipper putative tumor suppressor 2 homolog isoform X1 [Culex pipiens pallens]XP_039433746.1 leucine zipper putative tumor suppressor 2 homolog isoform X1 [Culex pipiens pallens]XP_052562161.1 leucine zipper putative tumor suppressor 2 homolog isoform X1 [Culex pipiens pallens]